MLKMSRRHLLILIVFKIWNELKNGYKTTNRNFSPIDTFYFQKNYFYLNVFFNKSKSQEVFDIFFIIIFMYQNDNININAAIYIEEVYSFFFKI